MIPEAESTQPAQWQVKTMALGTLGIALTVICYPIAALLGLIG